MQDFNNEDEIKSLAKKNRGILSRILDRISNGIMKNEKKYSTKIVNPEIYALNFPELVNNTQVETSPAETISVEEAKEVESFLQANDWYDEDEGTEKTLETTQSMITDKESYDNVINKLDSGEITEDNLSITDLLKINAMLISEIELKIDKYNLNIESDVLDKINEIKLENSNLDNYNNQ